MLTPPLSLTPNSLTPLCAAIVVVGHSGGGGVVVDIIVAVVSAVELLNAFVAILIITFIARTMNLGHHEHSRRHSHR